MMTHLHKIYQGYLTHPILLLNVMAFLDIFVNVSSSDYKLRLREPLFDVVKIDMLSTSIPNTIQNISDDNNYVTLYVKYNAVIYNNSSDGYRCTMRNGIYDIAELCDELLRVINATIYDYIDPSIGDVMTVTLVEPSSYLVISSTDTNFEFILEFPELLYPMLGFVSGTMDDYATELTNDMLPYKLFANKYLLLSVDEFNTSFDHATGIPFFAIIKTNTHIGVRTFPYFVDTFSSSVFVLNTHPINIEELTVRIYYESGSICEFRGAEHFFTLRVTYSDSRSIYTNYDVRRGTTHIINPI